MLISASRMAEATGLLPEDVLRGLPALEGEADDLKSPEFEVEGLALPAEDVTACSCCCPRKVADANARSSKKQSAATDSHQVLHLQRDLNYLDKVHEEKDLFIQKTRGELCASRQRIHLLTRQQENVAAEVAAEKEAGNVAAVGRLGATFSRLCSELDGERQLVGKITSALKESQNDMWHIEVEQGRLEAVRKALQEEVAAMGQHLQAQAAEQLCKEKAAARKVERAQQLRIREGVRTQREHGLRHQKLVEDVQRHHRIAVKFLKASLGRVRERERQEEMESREHLQRRMDAVLSLKRHIRANRETLQKSQAWGQARAALAEQKAQAEREAVLAQGGDAFKHLSHQRRRQELEAQKRAFEKEQSLQKRRIVARILKEAAEEGRRKTRLSAAKARARLTLRDKTWRYISDLCEGAPAAAAGPTLETEYPAAPKATHLVQAISSESVQGDPGGAASQEVDTLAQPEILGLWNEDCEARQDRGLRDAPAPRAVSPNPPVPREDADRRPMGGSALDEALPARTGARLRGGRGRRRGADGRGGPGRPFNSKPGLIHFKDFNVGRVYKKTIKLINATYSINFCKLVGVEAHLRDFIHVHFDPPGLLSAGMSCDVLVTFKPMVNKDLEGNVSFLAQTGEFSVPLKYSTKKCSLSLDKQLVDFGSLVVGETASRTITLTNIGGLGTKFKFLPTCEPDTSTSMLKMSSFLLSDDKSLYERVLPSLSEQQLDGDRSSQADVQSQKGSAKPGSRELGEGLPVEPERTTLTPITEMPPSEEQTEIRLGEVTEGDIGPFSSVKVPIIFMPVTPGEAQANFKVMFKNQQCPALYFRARGAAVDAPVWVPTPHVDLKICTYGRLYQDSVLVQSRSKAALRLKFEVCRELRAHMELLPQMGYVQAMSSCSVQLKFKPRHSLPDDAGKYFDKERRVLEAPMTIWVADQVKPVGFTVHAVVTTSDLELSPSEVDFGHCTIYEAIRTQVTLCNHSLLPQEFGFIGLPKFVDIQPNDGFGTIQPLESLLLDVVFQPSKAREYSFELVCKSEINRQFRVSCRAVGVHPPLELSHHQIKFRATALYDTSVATLYVVNSHLSTKSLTHEVPCVRSQGASLMGPTSFEFLPPPGAPLTISPAVGTVLPGKRCLVQVAFRPVLPDEEICREALEALSREAESKLRKDTATQRRDVRQQSLAPMRLHNQERLFRNSMPQNPELQKQELEASCDDLQAAQAALARAFEGKFNKFVVPCVVAAGDVKDNKSGESLSFSPHNTLYLELWCPAVAPPLVVVSDKGKTTFNFGDVAVGHRSIKKVLIQNFCCEDLAVEFSVLNPHGPFVLLNPFSRLRAGEGQVLALCFSPQDSVQARETLDVVSRRGTLPLTLVGTGLASVLSCSIRGGILDMGYVLARVSVSSSFKRGRRRGERPEADGEWGCRGSAPARDGGPGDGENGCSTLLRPLQQSEWGLFLGWEPTLGVGWRLGESWPWGDMEVGLAEGVQLEGEGAAEAGLTDPGALLVPAAERLLAAHKVLHEAGQPGPREKPRPGTAAVPRLVFPQDRRGRHAELQRPERLQRRPRGGRHRARQNAGLHRDLQPRPREPLLLRPAPGGALRQEVEEPRPILVTLDYVQLDTDMPAPPAIRELHVGCIRSTQLSPKKTVEFSVEGTAALQHKGFSMEPSRGAVERGQAKTITISWTPAADFDPDHPLTASALLQLRGDVKETYKVIFVAQVVSGS
ncbi:cilia- and flagella-associated protein 74-like isoform X3 [Tamandua tetradactyla]|uniref:cilia- and flagella-associated protein 74-like isoform X3 n=1 Tax=Tamandua tetradactyla TaxID=48850 RepID=UPI004053A463